MAYKDPEKKKAWARAAFAALPPEARRKRYDSVNAKRNAAYPKYSPDVSTPSAWLAATVDRANARGARHGMPFGVTSGDIALVETCPILGVAIVYGGRSAGSASLDKVDPAKGYVAGNVRIISRRANRMKADATVAELEAILAYVKGER